ncbi:MAG: hypothetical protein AAGA87_08590 [Pseudomonadota bacterium]
MIVLYGGDASDRAVDAKILFAEALSVRGHTVAIDASTLPPELARSRKYDLVRYAADPNDVTPSHIVVIGAEQVGPEVPLALRAAQVAPDVPVSVVGRFPDRQIALSATARIAHAVGREPTVVDLTTLQPAPLQPSALSPLATVPQKRPQKKGPPDVFLLVRDEDIEDPASLSILAALDRMERLRLHIIASAKVRDEIGQSRYAGLRIYGYSELSALAMAATADLLVVLGESVPGERLTCFALNVLRSGGSVADGTAEGVLAEAGAPVLRAPLSIAGLPAWLDEGLLSNLGVLGDQSAAEPWLRAFDTEGIEAALGLSAPTPPPNRPRQTHFVPTNGIGLGHARRCALIAANCESPLDFAAFPSCVSLLKQAGFEVSPLVQKSDDHPEVFANDLLNFRRLSTLANPGDTLVFDGGHIFDSIHRVMLERQLTGIWIRRGLWQASHMVRVQKERARAFDAIIAPDEAFPELRRDIGDAVHRVGPIVDITGSSESDKAVRRRRVLERFGRDGDAKLVVSLLGSGVLSGRGAQLQALAAMLERVPNCLHLVVVWPGATVSAGLGGWANTRVVRTGRAILLAEVADFAISAVGYNSFHELMYNRVPSILIPVKDEVLDDQESRAAAAGERGLADVIRAHEFLLLERTLTAFLEGDRVAEIKGALAAFDLPSIGTTDAARLIDERSSG